MNHFISETYLDCLLGRWMQRVSSLSLMHSSEPTVLPRHSYNRCPASQKAATEYLCSKYDLYRCCQRVFKEMQVPHLVGFIEGDLVALCGGKKLADVKGDYLATVGERLVRELGNEGLIVDVGIGGKSDGVADIFKSYREALEALEVVGNTANSCARRVMVYDQVGIYGLVRCLADCPNHGEFGNFGRDIVQAIQRYDAKHNTQLLETLEKYLEAWGNRKKAAQSLFIHPNTLDYRLNRIKQISGLDFNNADQCLAVLIWIKASRLSSRVALRSPICDNITNLLAKISPKVPMIPDQRLCRLISRATVRKEGRPVE